MKIVIYGLLLCLVLTACQSTQVQRAINSQEPNPDDLKLLSERCQFTENIGCMDTPRVTPTTIDLALRNDLWEDIVLTNIKSNTCKEVSIKTTEDYITFKETALKSGETFSLKLSGCENGDEEGYVREQVSITYSASSGLKRVAVGAVDAYVR